MIPHHYTPVYPTSVNTIPVHCTPVVYSVTQPSTSAQKAPNRTFTEEKSKRTESYYNAMKYGEVLRIYNVPRKRRRILMKNETASSASCSSDNLPVVMKSSAASEQKIEPTAQVQQETKDAHEIKSLLLAAKFMYGFHLIDSKTKSVIIGSVTHVSPKQTTLVICNVPKCSNTQEKSMKVTLERYGAVVKVVTCYLSPNHAFVEYFTHDGAKKCLSDTRSLFNCGAIEIFWWQSICYKDARPYLFSKANPPRSETVFDNKYKSAVRLNPLSKLHERAQLSLKKLVFDYKSENRSTDPAFETALAAISEPKIVIHDTPQEIILLREPSSATDFHLDDGDNTILGSGTPVETNQSTLLVRNIPHHVNTYEILHKALSRFGPIKLLKCQLLDYKNTAEVEFRSHSSAVECSESAIALLDKPQINVFWKNVVKTSDFLKKCAHDKSSKIMEAKNAGPASGKVPSEESTSIQSNESTISTTYATYKAGRKLKIKPQSLASEKVSLENPFGVLSKESIPSTTYKTVGRCEVIPHSFRIIDSFYAITGDIKPVEVEQTTLLVRDIPERLKSRDKLMQEFGKFGYVKTLEYKYLGLKTTSFVEYRDHTAAVKCFNSETPFLNLACIKVFWMEIIPRPNPKDSFTFNEVIGTDGKAKIKNEYPPKKLPLLPSVTLPVRIQNFQTMAKCQKLKLIPRVQSLLNENMKAQELLRSKIISSSDDKKRFDFSVLLLKLTSENNDLSAKLVQLKKDIPENELLKNAVENEESNDGELKKSNDAPVEQTPMTGTFENDDDSNDDFVLDLGGDYTI